MGWGLPGKPGTLGEGADTASVAKPTRLIIEDPSLSSSSSDDSLALTTSSTSTSSAPSSSGKPDFKEPNSKFTNDGVGKDKAGPGDSDGPGSTAPGNGSGQGKGKNDEPTTTRIFVTAEFDVGGVNDGVLSLGIEGGGSAFFDLDNNGILDAAEITSSNKATFGLGGNVDFGQGSFVVEFIGTGRALNSTFPTVNLDGFTEDDSIVVNFSQGWATGAGLNGSAIAILQRGLESAFKFGGYTFTSYTKRSTTGTSKFKVLQQLFFNGPTSGTSNSSRRLGVGVAGFNASGGFLLAGFSNFKKSAPDGTITANLIPGQTRKSAAPSLLAAWTTSTNTFINFDSQLTVVWPNTLGNGNLE